MIYSVHENHRTVIIADIMTDKIINQLFQRDRLRKKKKKTPPPITKEGKGSIIKRGDNVDSKSSVGDTGSITKKGSSTPPPSTGSKGKITKTPGGSSGSDVKPKSSIKTPPRNTSPPKNEGRWFRKDYEEKIVERPKSEICFFGLFLLWKLIPYSWYNEVIRRRLL